MLAETDKLDQSDLEAPLATEGDDSRLPVAASGGKLAACGRNDGLAHDLGPLQSFLYVMAPPGGHTSRCEEVMVSN